MVDQLTCNATLIETGTESYRLARFKTRAEQKADSSSAPDKLRQLAP
ncbi:ATPase [Streptomyces sp. IBSBF 2953]|nr:ATPase [Streptomyces hayashii]